MGKGDSVEKQKKDSNYTTTAKNCRHRGDN